MIAATVLVAASLMTFPGGVAFMIAAWLGCYSALLLFGHRGWPALAGCLLVVLVKRIDWPPGLGCLAAATGLAIVLELRWRREIDRPSFRRMRITMLAVVWVGWLGFAWDWHRSYHANHVVAAPDARPIVCIGDSLTSYPPRGGYPKHLARLIRAPVINLGQPGVTTAEALKQLPKLKAARPQALIIELGGHDFLKDPSWLKTSGRSAAKRNLEQLIAAARSLGAEVVIIEVPRGFVVDPFAGLERELARQFDLELVSDTAIRNFVLWSRSCPPGAWTGGPYLSDDGLHPNARGDEYLASVVFRSLTRLFGPEIASERP
ncbi:MAG TPA: GDSL-type esterase/lipase family protein [Pirellulales bacterium]|nr:GDSL-type esterase/lipase family protein [Pirellulales bacterium]